MMEMYKSKYDKILLARLETYIKDMWSKDKSSKSIYREVNDFLITLRDNEVITSYEYEQAVTYNDLQKGFLSDNNIIAKINKNSTLEELHDMYNQIETESGKTDFITNVLSKIRQS